jgi:hypothetical protein
MRLHSESYSYPRAHGLYKRRAFKEAEEGYRWALDIIKEQPESAERNARELELMSGLVRVFRVTRGYGVAEAAEATARTRALAENSGNVQEIVLHLFGMWAAIVTSGDLSGAATLADQLLDLAERDRSPSNMGVAHIAQVLSRCWRGDLNGADEHFTRGARFFEAAGVFFPGVATILSCNAAIIAW